MKFNLGKSLKNLVESLQVATREVMRACCVDKD